MIRSLYSSKTGKLRVDLSPTEIPSFIAKPQGLLWVDLNEAPSEETISFLTNIFHFHPLVVDNILNEDPVFSIDDWGDYVFASIIANNTDRSDWESKNKEAEKVMLKVLFNRSIIITQHAQSLDIINGKWSDLQRRTRKNGVSSLEILGELIGEVVESYMFAAQIFDERIIKIRFNKTYRNQNEQINVVREAASVMRLRFDALRSLIDRLTRNEFEIVDDEHRTQFRVIYEKTSEIRNEFLRLEDPLSSSQGAGSRPFFSKLATTFRRAVDGSNPIQAKSNYDARSIFISYRRADSADVTGRIYDRLIAHFGIQTVFKDVDSIRPGAKFKKDLGSALKKCKVVLAVIGNLWTNISDDHGHRLDNPEDFVRIEIESTLARGIPIIPILVQDAEMPSKHELPSSLADLIDHQGLRVRPDPDFHNDVDRLISHLETVINNPDILD